MTVALTPASGRRDSLGAEVVDANVNAYCSLDENGRRPQKELTTKEKEALFLEAMLVRRAAATDNTLLGACSSPGPSCPLTTQP